MSVLVSPTTFEPDFAEADQQLDDLRARLAGRLLSAESDEFDTARRVLYVNVDRRPLAIVRAANAGDVAEAVRFAADRGMPLAVRSGGHSLAHYSVVDDVLVVDLSEMKQVIVNPEARTARVQAGATSGDLAGPANMHSLALSTGDTHSVGMGGLTTGGGIGFMVRKYGLAIDNLLEAQVVTADGRIVTASAEQNADLFWGIRGGGGNFGIVTEFTYRLAPVGQILGGELILPASHAVIRGYLDYVATAPNDLTTIANIMHAPPAPHVPQERIGELVLSILICWTGDPAAGQQAIAPLRALARPVADAVGLMPYPDIYRFTAHQASPHGASIRSMFADTISDAAIEAMLEAMQNASSPFSLVQLRGMGGAMARVRPHETAFAHRTQRYFVAVIGLWLDAAEDERVHADWTNTLWNQLRPEGSGVYVNFLEREGADRVRDAYPAATFARLVALKRKYDPANMFRFNQNIPSEL